MVGGGEAADGEHQLQPAVLVRQLFETGRVERGLRVEQQLAEGRAEPRGDLLALAARRQAGRLDLVEPTIAVVDRAQDGQDLGRRRRAVAAGEGELERVEAGGWRGGRRAQWACARR
jgi:hypothetical protein